ncbi:hypothetical protein BLNAU_13281 [Blattamonas nauphoetae]|uniref:Uncharacterized protein n=1 Tax=Blattamonas nauphoetae TaxID=2049346 RepID=A0ABQ9XH53_9EUKA|nr:hypothetical protein BLNAU_13281 [Blattamonas nauphoetae]
MQTLVTWILDGNSFDEETANYAARFLQNLTPKAISTLNIVQLLLDMVPTPGRTCEGFVKSMHVLLSCGNRVVLLTTLHFVRSVIHQAFDTLLLDFLNSGFFTGLTSDFQKLEIHYNWHNVNLIRIAVYCIAPVLPSRLSKTSKHTKLSKHQLFRVLHEKMVKPLRPLLLSLCGHALELRDESDADDACNFVSQLLLIAPFHEPLFAELSSIPLSFALSNWLPTLTHRYLKRYLLRALNRTLEYWGRLEDEKVLRSRTLLEQLVAEGMEDGLEIHIAWNDADDKQSLGFALKSTVEIGWNGALEGILSDEEDDDDDDPDTDDDDCDDNGDDDDDEQEDPEDDLSSSDLDLLAFVLAGVKFREFFDVQLGNEETFVKEVDHGLDQMSDDLEDWEKELEQAENEQTEEETKTEEPAPSKQAGDSKPADSQAPSSGATAQTAAPSNVVNIDPFGSSTDEKEQEETVMQTLDAFNPETFEQFELFGELLAAKLTSLRSNKYFVGMMKNVSKEVFEDMKIEAIQEMGNHFTVLKNEKIKATRDQRKKKGAGKITVKSGKQGKHDWDDDDGGYDPLDDLM